MSTAAPIMVRAKITAAEWAALRKLAVDLNTTPPQLVADALRAAYPLTPAVPPARRSITGDATHNPLPLTPKGKR